MNHEQKIQNGAHKIISTCLGLNKGQELVVLFDETTQEVACRMIDAALQTGIHPTSIFAPVGMQIRYSSLNELPLALESAIRNASGLLTCLTDSNESYNFRVKIFSLRLDRQIKIGHMPGATLDSLAMADADYQRVSADCNLLALALLRGKEMDFITVDVVGQSHHLRMSLGGWERTPVISNALIAPGTWANIPPGETFIAPVEGSAKGEVVLRGSLPGYVIPPGKQIILQFADGVLSSWTSNDPGCIKVIEDLKNYALQINNPTWSVLAEIGIGVNPAIERLYGVEVLDEKKAGTAHIAIGANDWFGGRVKSDSHNDLVALSPTITIDGKPIMAAGTLVTDMAQWQERLDALLVDQTWISSFTRIARSGIQIESEHQKLFRVWKSGRGELKLVQVGDNEAAMHAHCLYHLLPTIQRQIEVQTLFSRVNGLDLERFYRLLRLLLMYELIRIS